MINQSYTIRNAKPEEFKGIGQLMVQVYSQLDGFPKPTEQAAYYHMLANIGDLTQKPKTELLVAVSSDNKLAAGLVYFSDMQYYGSGGTATKELNAPEFRLLAVDPSARGHGIGKLLTNACIQKTKDKNLNKMVIHTTMAMQTAWKMYENLGFKRSEDLSLCRVNYLCLGSRWLFKTKNPNSFAIWALLYFNSQLVSTVVTADHDEGPLPPSLLYE